VFDRQLAAAGSELVRGRRRLLGRLVPEVSRAYEQLAGDTAPVSATYEAEWIPAGTDDADLGAMLLEALGARRRAELDRGVTLAGPHRDEWRLLIGGLDSRTHASQGEQRSLALALRLGGHRLCTDLTGSPPVLLLDDVFSELDNRPSPCGAPTGARPRDDGSVARHRPRHDLVSMPVVTGRRQAAP
jgi:DNA replication and repair protein RecF